MNDEEDDDDDDVDDVDDGDGDGDDAIGSDDSDDGNIMKVSDENKEDDTQHKSEGCSLNNLVKLRLVFDKHVRKIYRKGYSIHGTTTVAEKLAGGGNLPLDRESAWKLTILVCELISLLGKGVRLRLFWIGKLYHLPISYRCTVLVSIYVIFSIYIFRLWIWRRTNLADTNS
jgi:hypothetical protein